MTRAVVSSGYLVATARPTNIIGGGEDAAEAAARDFAHHRVPMIAIGGVGVLFLQLCDAPDPLSCPVLPRGGFHLWRDSPAAVAAERDDFRCDSRRRKIRVRVGRFSCPYPQSRRKGEAMKPGKGLFAAVALGMVGFWGGSAGGPSYVASALGAGGSPPPECTKDHQCDDGNACTHDRCKDQKCERKPVKCDDGKSCTEDTCDAKKGCQHHDQCPDCTKAAPTVATLWPPNHKFVNVSVKGVTHPQGHPTTITFHGVAQDEPTNAAGDGNTCPDAMVGQGSASLRAERSGQGDGRVYHLFFKATDHKGNACGGEVMVCVPHDQGRGSACVDGGPLHDSLSCSP